MINRKGETRPIGGPHGKILPHRELDERASLRRMRRHPSIRIRAGPLGEERLRSSVSTPTASNGRAGRAAPARDARPTTSASRPQGRGQGVRTRSHVHNYPHCWRTNKAGALLLPPRLVVHPHSRAQSALIEAERHRSAEKARIGRARDASASGSDKPQRLEPLALAILGHARCRSGHGGTARSSSASVFGGRAYARNPRNRWSAGFIEENPYKNFLPGDMSAETTPRTASTCTPLCRFDRARVVEGRADEARKAKPIDVCRLAESMPYAQCTIRSSTAKKFPSLPADFIGRSSRRIRPAACSSRCTQSPAMLFIQVAFRKHHIERPACSTRTQNKMSNALGKCRILLSLISLTPRAGNDLQLADRGQPQVDKDGGRGAPQVLRHALQHLTPSSRSTPHAVDGFSRAAKPRCRGARPESTAGSSRCSTPSWATDPRRSEKLRPDARRARHQSSWAEKTSRTGTCPQPQAFLGAAQTEDKLAVPTDALHLSGDRGELAAPFAPSSATASSAT